MAAAGEKSIETNQPVMVKKWTILIWQLLGLEEQEKQIGKNITVKSIHVKKVPVLSANADKYVCLAVKIKPEIKNLLRHGQVIVNKDRSRRKSNL